MKILVWNVVGLTLAAVLSLGVMVSFAHEGDDDKVVVCPSQCPPPAACVCPPAQACPEPAPPAIYRPCWLMKNGTYKCKGDRRLVPVGH